MVAFVANLQAFKHNINMAKARIEGTVTSQKRSFVAAMLKDLAANTPQWSGDLAASWEVVVGENSMSHAINTPFKSVPREFPAPYFKGSMDAVNYAMMNNQEAIKSIRWNSHVAIVNKNKTLVTGDRGDNPLTNPAQLRLGNYIEGDFMAVHYVAQKYKGRNLKVTRFTYGS